VGGVPISKDLQGPPTLTNKDENTTNNKRNNIDMTPLIKVNNIN